MNFSLILRRELWKRNVWTTLLHNFKPTWSKLILIQTVLPGQKALAHIQLMCCVGQLAITFLKFSYGATFLVLKNQAFLHILNTFVSMDVKWLIITFSRAQLFQILKYSPEVQVRT